MAKELLNEAERFLLQNWGESRALEESMAAIRNKYAETFQRIVDGVMKKHAELDAAKVYVTQFWGSGSVGVGRTAWPSADVDWPTGFWVDDLRLETLSEDDSEGPCAAIWVSPKTVRKSNINVQQARDTVAAAAREIMGQEELNKCKTLNENDEYLLAYPILGKKELLHIFGTDDGENFVGHFISLFDSLARFTPVLDEIFGPRH